MDIFEFALARENDSERFYRNMAERCPDSGLKTILLTLAEAEVKHAAVIRHMQQDVDVDWQEDSFLADVKAGFSSIRDRGPEMDFSMAEVDLYKKAHGFEVESMELYRKGAAEASSDKGKALMLRLAGQEKMHAMILDTIVEVISRPLPGNWLEDAEWYHLEEY